MPVSRTPYSRQTEAQTSYTDQTQKRQDRIFEAADRAGLKERMMRLGEGVLESSAFQMIAGAFEREANAMASLVDVATGHGREGESVGHRFFRELIGGTKLGNAFGLGDPDREGWDKTLEQLGVAEGKTLSEMLTGEDKPWWIDPTARESFAMGLEIATAPSSWLTRGGAAVAKMAGRAGFINATKAGNKLAFRAYKSAIIKRAVDSGEEVAKGLAKAAELSDEAAAEFAKLEQRVLRREAELMGLQGLGKQGPQIAANKIMEQAERRVADRVLREGTKGLAHDPGLRFGDTRWLGLDQAGVLLVKDSVLSAPGRLFKQAIQAGDAKLLKGRVGEVIDWADKVFKRVPRTLRSNAMFRSIEKRRFITRNSAGEIADSHLDRIYGSSRKWFRKNRAAKRLLMHYIENPEKYADRVAELYPEMARDFERVRRRWVVLADGMGGAAVQHEFITPEQFLTHRGHYISHEIDLSKFKDASEFDNIMAAEIGPEWAGGSYYRYGNERRAKSLAQAEHILRKQGLDPDEIINWDAEAVMAKYIKTHVEAVADANFANDFVAHFSPTFQTVLQNLAPNISRAAGRVSKDDLLKIRNAKELARMYKDSPLFEKQYKEAIDAAANMSPDARAAYLYESMHNLNSIEDFVEFMETHKRVIAKTSNEDLANLRKLANNRAFFVDGERVVEFTFPKNAGRLAGQTRVVPAHMLEFFKENSVNLKNGLPKVVEDSLKMYDLMQNTFKVTHTIFAPAFHVRNAISNAAAVAQVIGLTPILNPARAKRVAQVLLGKGDDFTIKASNTGRRYTRKQLESLYNALDINPKRVQQAELVGGRETLVAKVGLGNFERMIGRGSQLSENFARGVYFQTLIERGYSPARAAELVKEALFDYADLSWTEANILRRIFPFYTWTRKNAEFQIKNLVNHPAGTATQIRLLNERGPESDLLPEYLRGELKVKLESKDNRIMFLTGIDLPVSNVDILWDGGVGNTMRNWMGLISPFLKSPQEFALDYDSFSQRSIRGRQFIGQIGPEIDRTWPEKLKQFVELERINAKDGSVYYKANGLKMWLIFKNVLIGRMARDTTRAADTVKTLGDGDTREGAIKLLRVMSGMTLQDLSLEAAQKKKLDENLRKWEDWLVEKGAMARGSYTWVPKGE